MTIEDINKLIADDETRTVEYKKTTGELKDAMHSLCAMLNSDGGYVVIGIHPTTKRILGQNVSDSTRQEIALALRKIEPFVNMPVEYINVPDRPGDILIVFHADKRLYGESPYVFDGKPYYKLESTTMPMPQPMYEDMLRRRDADFFRWDVQTATGMTIGNLSERRIRAAVALGIRNGRIDPSAEGEPIESLLGKLKLLYEGKPTNAAVMLFAENTDRYPEMELRMACFKGKNKSIFIDNKCEAGNFFDLLDAGIAFCVRNLRLGGEIKGLMREEKLEIPIEALREALTNALCHRQYERTNASVSLAIYDDRVEIVNPGKFPAQLSPEKIKLPHESYPHNKLIAQVLYLTTFLEKWGSGAERIMQLCKEQELPEPDWKVENGTVSIVFKRPKAGRVGERNGENNGGDNGGNQLTERQRTIYQLIKSNGGNSVGDLARTLRLSRRTIEREMSYLKKLGYIERQGTKGGNWIILK